MKTPTKRQLDAQQRREAREAEKRRQAEAMAAARQQLDQMSAKPPRDVMSWGAIRTSTWLMAQREARRVLGMLETKANHPKVVACIDGMQAVAAGTIEQVMAYRQQLATKKGGKA